MPWPSNGDYYGFKEEAIKSYAPPISGVYGIYNFNHHIRIGHTNNLREALLRHHKEPKFRFRRLQPSGFTFEVCPTELKAFRAQELIWEYEPILQDDASIGMGAWWHSWITSRARASHSARETSKSSALEAAKPYPLKAPEKPHAEHARTRREEYAMLASGIAFVVVAMVLYGLLAQNKTIAESWTRRLLSLAQSVTSSLSANPRTAALPPTVTRSETKARPTDAPIQSTEEQPAPNTNNPPSVSPSIAIPPKS